MGRGRSAVAAFRMVALAAMTATSLAENCQRLVFSDDRHAVGFPPFARMRATRSDPQESHQNRADSGLPSPGLLGERAEVPARVLDHLHPPENGRHSDCRSLVPHGVPRVCPGTRADAQNPSYKIRSRNELSPGSDPMPSVVDDVRTRFEHQPKWVGPQGGTIGRQRWLRSSSPASWEAWFTVLRSFGVFEFW